MDYEGRFIFSKSFESIALLYSSLFVADGRSGASDSHSFVCCFLILKTLFFIFDTLKFHSSILNVGLSIYCTDNLKMLFLS